jgi:glycosyltransferase involved in cell wall biosynthesis
MTAHPDVHVAGFFPPPVTGQAMATQQLADLLGDDLNVDRVDLNVRQAGDVAESRFRLDVLSSVLRRRDAWRAQIADDAPVLWTGISPSRWGVWRDALLTSRLWRPDQRAWGVVHHGIFAQAFDHAPRRVALAQTLGRLAGLVFVTEGLKRECAPHTGDLPLHVIPNTLPASAIAAAAELDARRAPIERTSLRLLFLSNMLEDKGYGDLLEAAALLHRRGELDRVTFAGAWPSDAARQAFMDRTAALGLTSRVDVLGAVYDAERKRRLFLDADVFVLPSRFFEVQPLVIAEALATGTPVVTTRQGGIPEQVGAPEAAFVDLRDPAGIAQTSRALLDRPRWLEASHAARARFDAAYHPDAVRRLWLDLLRSR